MSCNGCRVLRKGCSEECMLRHCLEWIQSPQAQAHATLFVAKFFGRAALMSFLSAVPPSQRPPLFESLLYEAVGRSINPVNGAVGLLWTGNWRLCQLAVQTVLRGGALNPLPPEFISGGGGASVPADDDSFDESNQRDMREGSGLSLSRMLERKVMINGNINISSDEVDDFQARHQRLPSEEEDSETTAFQTTQRKLLTLFF